MPTFRLAIEEVAFAMGYVGGETTAAGFLASLIGERTPEELTGRLTVASHSLIARALLIPEPLLPEAALDSVLQQAVEGMIRGDDVLRATVSANGRDQVVTFFLAGARAVQHELIQGVVSEITLLHQAEEVCAAVADVVAPPDLLPAGVEPLGRIPVDQLRELRLRANTISASEFAALLSEVNAAVADAIVAVMRDASASWTVTLRLMTGEAGTVESSRGFFTVFVQDAGWLFDMSSDPLWASVYALHHSTAAAATARLMAA